MRLVKLSGFCAFSVIVVGTLFTACGSDNAKRRPMIDYTNGGAGGADALSGVGAAAGESGTTADAGAGGVAQVTEGGAAGAVSVAAGGGAGGSPTGSAFHGLYVGVTGNDAADGSVDAPFMTLAHAASIAVAGDTIVFLDGTFTKVNGPVAIPDGVDLMAENSGAVTLSPQVPGTLLNLAGTTHIGGLKFTGYPSVATYPAGAIASGALSVIDSSFASCSSQCLATSGSVVATVTNSTFTSNARSLVLSNNARADILDSTFTNCTGQCLVLSDAAQAVVNVPIDQVLGNGGTTFATLSNTASLSVTGGVLKNYGNGQLLTGADDTSLSLTNLKILDGSGHTLALSKQGVATLDKVLIATTPSGGTVISQTDSTRLTVKNSDISMNAGVVTKYNCFSTTGQGIGALVLEDTKIHACGTGIKGAIPGTLTLLRTEVYNLDYGMDLVTGGPNLGGTIAFTDSKFHDFKAWGARIGDGGSLVDFTMRRTSVTVANTATGDGVIINASNASNYDFGTLASPGGNVILGASPAHTGLRINLGAATIQAVGNTWTPNVQAADALGKYSVPNPGDKLDITGAVVPGQNYIKSNSGVTLRLAENAP